MTGAPEDVSDLDALADEFPAWDFDTSWTTTASGPEYRTIWGWNLNSGERLTAPDADEMRRKIRGAGG